jgi:hypothetical protein
VEARQAALSDGDESADEQGVDSQELRPDGRGGLGGGVHQHDPEQQVGHVRYVAYMRREVGIG